MLVLPRDLGFFELGNGEPGGRLGALPGPGPLPLPQGGHLTPAPLPLPAGEGGLWETGWPCRMGPFWQPHVLVIAGSLCSHSPGLHPGWPSWFLVGQVAQVALGWQGSPCPAGLLLPGQLPSFRPSFRPVPAVTGRRRGKSLAHSTLFCAAFFWVWTLSNFKSNKKC